MPEPLKPALEPACLRPSQRPADQSAPVQRPGHKRGARVRIARENVVERHDEGQRSRGFLDGRNRRRLCHVGKPGHIRAAQSRSRAAAKQHRAGLKIASDNHGATAVLANGARNDLVHRVLSLSKARITDQLPCRQPDCRLPCLLTARRTPSSDRPAGSLRDRFGKTEQRERKPVRIGADGAGFGDERDHVPVS